MKRATWIISEQGLQSLMTAGISIGWLKAWLLSAGAEDVVVYLLESGLWQDCSAELLLFFAGEDELKSVAQHDGYSDESDKPDEPSRINDFTLGNPEHRCHFFSGRDRQMILLPLGDIAYQRHDWLCHCNGGKTLLPLYVRADDSLTFSLEPGLSASLDKSVSGDILNAEGMLIEEQVIATLREHKLSIRTAESCTAGGIAARLCRVPGASDVVDRGWVTYSNQAKQEELGVEADLLGQYGAVSEAVVGAMAEGGADAKHVCVAVSGVAGPGGGTDEKPVGTVWIAIAGGGLQVVTQCLHLSGARHEIQTRTVIAVLSLLLTEVEKFRG